MFGHFFSKKLFTHQFVDFGTPRQNVTHFKISPIFAGVFVLLCRKSAGKVQEN